MGCSRFCRVAGGGGEWEESPIRLVDSQKKTSSSGSFFVARQKKLKKIIKKKHKKQWHSIGAWRWLWWGSVDERAVAREVNISFPALCFPQLFLIRQICHNCSPVACQTCPPQPPSPTVPSQTPIISSRPESFPEIIYRRSPEREGGM